MAFFGVYFFTAHKLVFDSYITLDVNYDDSRAITGAISWDVGQIQHSQVAKPFFQLADASVYESLSLLGVLILGVFGKVAVGTRDGDFLWKFDIQLVVELVNFFMQLLFDFRERIHG